MRFPHLPALFSLVGASVAALAGDAVSIYPRVCKPGIHTVRDKPYALYIFFDDAAGTNVAVLAKGDPTSGLYGLGKRFWQGEPWALDVTSYAWIPGYKRLVLATSDIYGTGLVYLLDLDAQRFDERKPTAHAACLVGSPRVEGQRVFVAVTDCESRKRVDVEFPI